MDVSTTEITKAEDRDRRALLVFMASLVALCAVFNWPLLASGSLNAWNGWAVFLLMWAPGAAGLVASTTAYGSLRPLGLLGNQRAVAWSALCVLLPLLYTLLIYRSLDYLGIVDARVGELGLTVLALGFLQSVMSAFGEELGWRGFASPVFTRLFGFRSGQLALGLIWYLYHLPPLLFTEYGASPHRFFGNAMFMVTVVILSIFLGYVRQQSDSVWPSTLYHASHNLFFFLLFYPVVPKAEIASWLTGEQGAALAVLYVAAAIAVFSLKRPVTTIRR